MYGGPPGEHDAAPDAAVLQTETVSDLVHGHLGQVHPPEAAQRPELVIIEVDVTRCAALPGEEGVGESSAAFVERVPVPVLASLPPDLKVTNLQQLDATGRKFANVVYWQALGADFVMIASPRKQLKNLS